MNHLAKLLIDMTLRNQSIKKRNLLDIDVPKPKFNSKYYVTQQIFSKQEEDDLKNLHMITLFNLETDSKLLTGIQHSPQVDLTLRKPESASLTQSICENGTTTALQPPKIVPNKGCKQIGQIVASEKFKLVAFRDIIISIPSVYIFSRVRFKKTILARTPEDNIGIVPRSG
ncbi:hypothetical protein ILUMI_10956 [Ignelater luminosus]|uniref:Uncharacterized protein n=1 Tax=Ignelater luminosus TaxID=2038154 RepID=A0A8K0G867_IGNLU|nr:hypothetical protein ILUMI_10956 [Ignelater luminosus]